MRPCLGRVGNGRNVGERRRRRRGAHATHRCLAAHATNPYWMQQVIIGSAWNILAILGARSNNSFLPTTPSSTDNSRASRRESLFGADRNVFFGRAAQAEAFEAELLAEPTVRGNKSFFGKNDSGDPQRRPRAGLRTRCRDAPCRLNRGSY